MVSSGSYSRFHINQPQIVGWALPTKLYCYGFCEVVGDAHPTGNRCNVATALKRGIYTIEGSLVIKVVGKLADVDIETLEQSLLFWLGL
jgi:hypothetical protein